MFKKTHGLSNTRAYRDWVSMRQRCNNPNNKKYHRYGGRGIMVDKRWESYTNFLEDMGERPEGKQIDRIDNSGNYTKENCRWATPRENSRNKYDTHIVEYRGKMAPLIELIEKSGISYQTVISRIKVGWDLERALTQKPFKPAEHLMKKVTDGKTIYESISQAAREYGVATPTVQYWLKNKKQHWEYV